MRITAIILIFCSVALTNIAHAQFVGKITYKDSYQSKNPSISSADFEKFMGSKREFYVKESFYKTVNYGELASVTLYRGDVNRLYIYNEGADTVLWVNALKKNYSKIDDYKIENSAEIILGRECKKLTIHSQLGTFIYYYSNDLPINPIVYKSHNVDFWNFYTNKAKSIPLKIIYDGPEIVLTSVAVKIESVDVKNDIFKIPKGYLKENLTK